jgi:hypothetical protein
MAVLDDLDLRYLQALLGLNTSIGHGVRSHLGGLALQITLIREIVKRSEPSPEAWQKLGAHAEKAEVAFRELTDKVEQILATTRPPERVQAAFDLRSLVRHVEALIGQLLRDHRSTLKVTLPSEPVMLDGSRDVIQRALVVSLLSASLATSEGQVLELRLDDGGVLEVEGPPAHLWLPSVADIIENIGGGFETSPTASVVAMRLPIQTRAG